MYNSADRHQKEVEEAEEEETSTLLKPHQREAVYTHHLNKSYGKFHALRDVNMTVERGSIYGLLGPSGCGKTTLLKSILGMLKPADGELTVFGSVPGLSGLVPGSDIGYMPQEIACYRELAVSEILRFHSRLHSLDYETFKQREQDLLDFLDLPPSSRIVESLSGGQQRRVSLAIALLHNPKLIILDEPTVGVDPVLRESIWKHLRKLADQDGVTVIITTHYIEEARMADRVGLMRQGTIIAEDSPAALMQIHSLPTLEDVFLHLCRKRDESSTQPDDDVRSGSYVTEISTEVVIKTDDDADENSNSNSNSSSSEEKFQQSHVKFSKSESVVAAAVVMADANDHDYDQHSYADRVNVAAAAAAAPSVSYAINAPNTDRIGAGEKTSSLDRSGSGAWSRKREDEQPMKEPRCRFGPRPRKTCALSLLGCTRLRRNYAALAFDLLIPTIEICLFCLAIGPDPKGLSIAVVNHDVGAEYGNLGWNFVNNLNVNHTGMIVTHNYTSYQDGVNAVRAGTDWAVIYIPANFSQDLPLRNTFPYALDPNIYEQSTIYVRMDMSSQSIVQTLVLQYEAAFEQTLKDFLISQSLPTFMGSLPLQEDAPIYGEATPKFIDFLAPGILVITSFAHAIALTAVSFVMERTDGTLDRVFAAGGRPIEIVLGHFIVSFFLIIIQTGIMLTFVLAVFKVPIVGSVALLFLLNACLGLTGTCFGLVISSFTTMVHTSMQLAAGSFFPAMLLSGVLWPQSAIPTWLIWLSYAMPTYWAADAARSVMIRGWGIDHGVVWQSLVISLGWMLVLLAIASFKLRTRK